MEFFVIERQSRYRPCGTRLLSATRPGTAVPGFPIPPLRGCSVIRCRLSFPDFGDGTMAIWGTLP